MANGRSSKSEKPGDAAASWEPIASLKPWPDNPRKNDSAVPRVADSIVKFGWGRALVAREENREIVVGHTAFKAAALLKVWWSEDQAKAPGERRKWHSEAVRTVKDAVVPVRLKAMSAEDAHLLAAADNRLNEFAEWDDTKVLELLRAYDPVDVQLAGWDDEALAKIIAGVTGAAASDDEIPEAPSVPITKVGDLILLGRHRLLCGDATSEQDVARLLDGAKPELMVTDPPYGVDYDPAWRVRAAKEGHLAYAARRTRPVKNDDRSDWKEAYALAPCNVAYLWHAAVCVPEVASGLVGCGFELRNLIIWAKAHFPIGRGHYHHRHEPCWYAVRKSANAKWIGDRKQTTLWEVTLDANVGGEEGGHSTQKPIELMMRPLRNHDGDVYDPFVGSGTTLIAAERLERTCYAMDLDPVYCDVVVARWEKATGKVAERVPAVAAE